MKSTRRIPRRKRTRRKRRGGKKIGYGANGVVIDPAIPCIGKDITGKVSKVFFGREKFEKARQTIEPLLAKLNEIDRNQTSFLYPELCYKVGKRSKENEADGVTEKTKHYSYLMNRGGNETLLGFIIRTKPSEDKIVAMLKEVQELLNKLHDNNILHGDFHSTNVLRMDDGTFRIIDFDSAQIVDLSTDTDGRIKNQIKYEGYYIVEDVSRAMGLNYEKLEKKVFPR